MQVPPREKNDNEFIDKMMQFIFLCTSDSSRIFLLDTAPSSVDGHFSILIICFYAVSENYFANIVI